MKSTNRGQQLSTPPHQVHLKAKLRLLSSDLSVISFYTLNFKHPLPIFADISAIECSKGFHVLQESHI